MSRRLARWAFLAAGIALLLWLSRAVGWPAIEANLRAIGGWFPFLVALYLLAQSAFFLSWWTLMDPRPRLVRWPRLFAIYLAGDSANYLAPGGVAGEPLKVRLLSEEMETGRALASVTLSKHVELVAQWLFALSGVAVTLGRFPLSARARLGAVAGVAVLGTLLALLTWGLRRGTYAPALRWLSRFESLASFLSPHHEGALAVDDRIRQFYADRRGRFAAAVGLCFLGWCGGWLETFLVLRLLAPGSGWATAMGVEALSVILTTMLLFIPARAGGAEGARTGICLLLGLTAAQGVAYGLVRRARELVWTLPGLLVLLVRHGDGSRREKSSARIRNLANGGIRS